MMGGLVGGVALALVALAFEIIAQAMKRMALRSPAILERAEAVRIAKENGADLFARCKKLQETEAATSAAIDKLRLQIKKAEARLARVTTHHRIVEEIGLQTSKSQRFDATVWNALANWKNVEVNDRTPPSHFAKEVQIIIWAQSIGEARQLFEKTFPTKDGYQGQFLGDVFGKN